MGELAGVVLRTALDAGYLLAAGVLPPLIAGIVLQFVTSLFGVCCIEVFGIRFCVWATAPGVMMHEFSHALACLVFRHRINAALDCPPQKTELWVGLFMSGIRTASGRGLAVSSSGWLRSDSGWGRFFF